MKKKIWGKSIGVYKFYAINIWVSIYYDWIIPALHSACNYYIVIIHKQHWLILKVILQNIQIKWSNILQNKISY